MQERGNTDFVVYYIVVGVNTFDFHFNSLKVVFVILSYVRYLYKFQME